MKNILWKIIAMLLIAISHYFLLIGILKLNINFNIIITINIGYFLIYLGILFKN